MKANPKNSPDFVEKNSIPVPETGCWLWLGTYDSHGYGVFKLHCKHTLAHRYSYAAYKHKDVSGLFVCHKCDTPTCVNPEHLFLGTPADNMRDKSKKGRASRLAGETNPMAKLTNIQTKAIVLDDRNQYVIAKAYGISQGRVSIIKKKGRINYVP